MAKRDGTHAIYRFMDFGTSRMYDPAEQSPRADIYYGRDNKAPELNKEKPYDPFPADVHALGVMLLSILFVSVAPLFARLVVRCVLTCVFVYFSH